MNFTKDFGFYTKIRVALQPEIFRVEVYDLKFSFCRPAFVLGYICGNKTNLCTGWTTVKSLDDQVKFAEAVMEAHHIFQEDFTERELKLLGYENESNF